MEQGTRTAIWSSYSLACHKSAPESFRRCDSAADLSSDSEPLPISTEGFLCRIVAMDMAYYVIKALSGLELMHVRTIADGRIQFTIVGDWVMSIRNFPEMIEELIKVSTDRQVILDLKSLQRCLYLYERLV